MFGKIVFVTFVFAGLVLPGRCESTAKIFYGDDCYPLGGPSGHYYADCNICTCKNGYLMDCSNYRCTSEPKDFFMVCVEREMKFEGCSVCRCKNEAWTCLDFCPPSTTNRPQIQDTTTSITTTSTTKNYRKRINYKSVHDYLEKGLRNLACAPSDLFKLHCSRCTCNENGRGYKCAIVVSEKCPAISP